MDWLHGQRLFRRIQGRQSIPFILHALNNLFLAGSQVGKAEYFVQAVFQVILLSYRGFHAGSLAHQ
jgi:hypothetical protein